MFTLDAIDRRMLIELDTDARLSVAVLAQRLKLARGTVHARLARLEREGVFRGNTTRIEPAVLGRPLWAMIRAEVDQHVISEAVAALAQVPEVLECFAPAGDTDLMMRVVAADAADLYRVSEAVRLCPGIVRTSTSVFLKQVIPYRTIPLIETADLADRSRTSNPRPPTTARHTPSSATCPEAADHRSRPG